MSPNPPRNGGFVAPVLALMMVFACLPSARANIYATNIKLNGGTANLNLSPGDSVSISYILNEPASLGVTLNIVNGNNVVRSYAFAPNTAGALLGTNSVLWDGKDASSNNVAPGSYSVSITAGTSGYTNWTQLTTDSTDNPRSTYVFYGRGIAVDRNPNSIYYGRIFVANSQASFPPDIPGNVVGILKFNADATGADEGVIVPGQDGYDWAGDGRSPWKVEVSSDDYVYVVDLHTNGVVLRWDALVTSNSLVQVLRQDNQPVGAHLSGPAIALAGTNVQLWMGDDANGLGLLRWTLTNGVCATNDTGLTVVGTDPLALTAPVDVALDPAGNIYTCQYVDVPGDTSPRVFRFPAYDPSTNSNLPEITPTWAIGTTNDDFGGASGVAIDPTGKYLAVSFEGILVNFLPTNGNTAVFYATNGALAATIDLRVQMPGQVDNEHQDTDCAWDAVGNLYYIDNWLGYWRTVSPPGTNQATTVSAITMQIGTAAPPQITGVTITNGLVTLTFTGMPGENINNFLVLGAAVVTGPYTAVPGVLITQLSPGIFQARFSANGSMQFYQVVRTGVTPPQAPTITNLRVAGGTVTINFTGSTSDAAAAFTLLSSTGASGPYSSAPGANITLLSPGVFQATASAPANSPMQFYRIRR
jgi:hypothetical protein